MEVYIDYDEEQSLLTLEAKGAWPDDHGSASFTDQLEKTAAFGAARLLIDYSELSGDVSLDDLFRFFETSKPIIDQLKAVKTAAVLNDRLNITSVVLSIMFSMGVRIAIFNSRAEAIAWLLGDDTRPVWMPNGD